ncbi:MAG: transposase [Parabacteroides sp.]|nr:transposase [Parabacteroides sp.]
MLVNKVNREKFEKSFPPLYCENNSRPAKRIRLMVGLILVRHLRNISNERVVEEWQEIAYYQYFCGFHEFSINPPCNATELIHFRKLIGAEGTRLILEESIRINHDHYQESSGTVYIGSTVQEKNITYPTDAKLIKKIISKCKNISEKHGFEERQSYSRILKKVYLEERFWNNPRNHKKALRADRKLRTITGRLVRELERHLKVSTIEAYDKLLVIFHHVLEQTRCSNYKIFSLHEPQVECIGKG